MASILNPLVLVVQTAQDLRAGEYRPTAWDAAAQTMITVPATSQPGTDSVVTLDGAALPGAPPFVGKPPINYVFDAILRAEHDQRLQITQHPVQTGASISDHAYRIQPKVTLEIGMSDAMESYDPDTWSNASSKSVSAYQTVLDLQKNRTMVTLTTRLDTYENMLVESIQTPDTYKTKHGLRMTVVFAQIFIATVTSAQSRLVFGEDVSARPQTTASTSIGELQAIAPSQALTTQHKITSNLTGAIPAAITAAHVPGAGLWSSVNVNSLKSLVN